VLDDRLIMSTNKSRKEAVELENVSLEKLRVEFLEV
jgi:hypothetical protein